MSEPFERIGAPRTALRPGRAALFSDAGGRCVALACERCGSVTPLGARGLVRTVRPPVWLLPWRRHPLRARCPACRRRAWLRPRLRL